MNEENPFEGLKKVFQAAAAGDECEVCGSEESVDMKELLPLNPITGDKMYVHVCSDCGEGLKKHNEVAEDVEGVVEMFADGMANQFLSEVEGLPLWGEPTVSEFTDLPNVGQKRAERLRDAGFETIDDLHKASVVEIADRVGMDKSIAWDIKGGLAESANQSLIIKARHRASETDE